MAKIASRLKTLASARGPWPPTPQATDVPVPPLPGWAGHIGRMEPKRGEPGYAGPGIRAGIPQVPERVTPGIPGGPGYMGAAAPTYRGAPAGPWAYEGTGAGGAGAGMVADAGRVIPRVEEDVMSVGRYLKRPPRGIAGATAGAAAGMGAAPGAFLLGGLAGYIGGLSPYIYDAPPGAGGLGGYGGGFSRSIGYRGGAATRRASSGYGLINWRISVG